MTSLKRVKIISKAQIFIVNLFLIILEIKEWEKVWNIIKQLSKHTASYGLFKQVIFFKVVYSSALTELHLYFTYVNKFLQMQHPLWHSTLNIFKIFHNLDSLSNRRRTHVCLYMNVDKYIFFFLGTKLIIGLFLQASLIIKLELTVKEHGSTKALDPGEIYQRKSSIIRNHTVNKCSWLSLIVDI